MASETTRTAADSLREQIAEILSGRGVVLRSQAALIDELAALLSPADAPTVPAEPREPDGYILVREGKPLGLCHETLRVSQPESVQPFFLRAAPVAPTAPACTCAKGIVRDSHDATCPMGVAPTAREPT